MAENSKDGEWRGFGQEIATATKLQINVVYRCIGILETIGSLKKLRHGAYKTPSLYKLIKEPDGDEYIQMKEVSVITGRLEMPTSWQRVQDSLSRMRNELNEIHYELNRMKLEMAELRHLRERMERLENAGYDLRGSP